MGTSSLYKTYFRWLLRFRSAFSTPLRFITSQATWRHVQRDIVGLMVAFRHRLAKKATTQIGPFSTIDDIRMQILNQSAQLVQQISGLLYDSDGPPDSAESDDCSVSATAEQVSHARDSVLQPRSVSVL